MAKREKTICDNGENKRKNLLIRSKRLKKHGQAPEMSGSVYEEVIMKIIYNLNYYCDMDNDIKNRFLIK